MARLIRGQEISPEERAALDTDWLDLAAVLEAEPVRDREVALIQYDAPARPGQIDAAKTAKRDAVLAVLRDGSKAKAAPSPRKATGGAKSGPPTPKDEESVGRGAAPALQNGEPPPPPEPLALRHALSWLAAGCWPVVISPIAHPGPNPGKKPLGGNDWGKERPTPERLRALYEATPDAGLGLLLGCEGGVVDLDVDDPEAAAPALVRLFPDGLPETRGWTSNGNRFHLLFRYDERLARYGKRIIKGQRDEKTGKVLGNPAYLGLELRIGTTDPADPTQTQSVIPPSRKADGTRRRWDGPAELLDLPESVFEDLDRYANPPKAAPSQRQAMEKASTGTPTPKAAPSTGRGEEPPRALQNGEPRSHGKPSQRTYDRNAVLNAVTGDEGRFLDLLGELGVRLTGRLTDDGWLECHAIDREDSEPSAGISPSAVYHDFGTETNLSLFDLAARCRPDLYRDWRAACNALGEQFLDHGHSPGGSGRQAHADQDRAGEGLGDWPDDETTEVNEAADDPHRLARVFLERSHPHPERPTLAHWKAEWIRWDGAAWIEWDDLGAKKMLNRAIKREFDRLNRAEVRAWQQEDGMNARTGKPILRPVARQVGVRLVGDVSAALAGLVNLESRLEQPAWLGEGAPPFPPSETLATRNALVHFPSLAKGETRTAPLTPCLFNSFALPFDFVEKPPATPAWDRFLASLFGDDEASVRLLQQWFGYILTPCRKHHKALMIIGPRRAGKGTLGAVAAELVGLENAIGPSLTSLADRFGLEDFLGKQLAVFGDARLSGKTDNAVVVDRLLNLTAFDLQTVQRKNRVSWNGRLAAKLMMLSNELPRFRETSGALAGRFLYLKLTKSFYGREDKTLLERLKAELPGLLHWAARGWADLEECGRFFEPQTSGDTAQEMEELTSPIGQFLAEHADIGGHAANRCPTKELFERWQAWCGEHGRDYIGDHASFSRDIKAAVPEAETKVLRWQGTSARCFTNIRLKTTGEIAQARAREAEANEAALAQAKQEAAELAADDPDEWDGGGPLGGGAEAEQPVEG